MRKSFHIVWIAALLSTVLAAGGAGGHSSSLTAKITMPDGSSRTLRLDGVGCSAAICSRTAMKGSSKDHRMMEARLDSIASIRHTAAGDALLVMRDGSERRLALIKDFRVLYLRNPSGTTERLDLAGVKSVEFTQTSH